MTNNVLLLSSYIFGSLQVIWMIYLNTKRFDIICNIICGIITSIINHGRNSLISKWLDRFMMLIGIYIDLCIIDEINNFNYYICNLLILLAIFTYILSKYILLTVDLYYKYKITLCNITHIISHLFITSCHFVIIYYFSQ